MVQAPLLLSLLLDVDLLRRAQAGDLVAFRPHPDADLWVICYTRHAHYANAWTKETILARGLVTDRHPLAPGAQVLARPFPKFVSAPEHGPTSPFGPLPTGPFEVTEKVDGSLAVLYHGPDGPAISTKGSFDSDQAVAASLFWKEHVGLSVPAGLTLLFEYVSPDNQVVVAYHEPALIFLAAIDTATGADVEYPEWTGPRVSRFTGLATMQDLTRQLAEPSDSEGFVVRFLPETPGTPSVRVKYKYAEYLRLHKIVSGISTLSIWETLSSGRSIDELLEIVPDEFDPFVRRVQSELTSTHESLVSHAYALAQDLRHLSRKEAAARIVSQSAADRSLTFLALDGNDVVGAAWKIVRPEFAQP
jgi:RNA ligase